MATHSSILAWGIPGTGEPDGLPSTGLHRVGHDRSDLAAAAAAAAARGILQQSLEGAYQRKVPSRGNQMLCSKTQTGAELREGIQWLLIYLITMNHIFVYKYLKS